MRVLVSDPIAQDGLDILKSQASVDVRTRLSEDELVEARVSFVPPSSFVLFWSSKSSTRMSCDHALPAASPRARMNKKACFIDFLLL